MAYDFQRSLADDSKRMKRRRWISWYLGVGMIFALALPVIEMLSTNNDHLLVANLAPITTSLLIGMALSPFARSSWITLGECAAFDECERDILARATQRAYSAMLGLLSIALGWLWLATVRGWPMPQSPVDWSSWGISIVMIGAVLPVFFAEIMVPFPQGGDEEDDR